MQYLTESQTINYIVKNVEKLEEKTEELASKIIESVNAERLYKLALAKATLRADGKTAEIRKAQALIECEQEYNNYMIDSSGMEACKELVRSLRENANNVRSLNASVRGQTNEGGF